MCTNILKCNSYISQKGIQVVYLRGTPNDGFLLNALKTLLRLSRVLSDLQECILSGAIKFVSVRSSKDNLSLFETTRASYYFPENLDAILSFTKVRIFLIPLLIAFLNPSQVSFFYEKQANLGTEMRKIKLQKILGNLLDMLGKLKMNETVIQKFSAFLKLQKILGNFCFSEQTFYRKQSLAAPDLLKLMCNIKPAHRISKHSLRISL